MTPTPGDTALSDGGERDTVTACTYCGCDVEAHDPVVVFEGSTADGDPTGRFCNYGCLVAHVDAEGLATGSTCEVDP